MKNLPIHLKILGVLLIAFLAIGLIKAVFNPGINLYNDTKTIALNYDAVVQQQVSNYDGYYNTFVDKQENANINKSTFVEVTNIIMSNRRDGENLAWKWNQENQQIPYGEFTAFYHDLSSFIQVRYEDNMAIERQKQQLVRDHNTKLALYPNNIYNNFLHIKPLIYRPGYITDATKAKFK